MAIHARFQIVAAFVALTIIVGIYSAKYWSVYENGSNFAMYYTAACLVRSGASTHIYDVIDPNTNPQQAFADPKSLFAETARAHGISRITLYLYPPTLADLIVPLSFVPAPAALTIWNVINILMIVGMSLVLVKTLGIRFQWATVVIAAAILLYRPTLNTFHWGQVTVLLAALVTIGLYCYIHGHKSLAAFLFALAIAVKLEPIVVLIPLVAWRDWRCLRNVALWGVLLCFGLWIVNGGQALSLYFLHQLPAMSEGMSANVNRSLGNIVYTCLGGANFPAFPHGLSWLVRALSALILGYAGWLSRATPPTRWTLREQFEIGMVFLLFACCLSPYSWFYNWALSAPVVVMFCKRVWDRRANNFEAFLLIALLLSLSTSRFHMAMVTPICGIALGLVVLQRMQRERDGAIAEYGINERETATAS